MVDPLLVQAILNGLQRGVLLFLVASGLSIIFGLLGVINFAHGALYMIGAYLALTVIQQFGSYAVAIVVAVLLVGLIGVAIEYGIIRKIYDRDIDQILLTFGLAVIIEQLVVIYWGPRSQSFPIPRYFIDAVTVGGIRISYYQLFVIGLGFAVMVGLWYLLARTEYGAIIQAGVEDTEMVESIGINVRRLFTVVFGLGAGLAALAAVIAAPQSSVEPQMGVAIIIEAFIVVVIGGLGKFRGVVVASLFVGMAKGLGNMYVPDLTESLLFVIVILVLLVRPEGLFGSLQHTEH